MQTNKLYLICELTILFLLIPCFLFIAVPIGLKVAIVLLAFFYVIRLTVSQRLASKHDLIARPVISYRKFVLLRFGLLVICSIIFMYLTDDQKLFLVVRNNPALWIGISIFYSLLSVYPQEFVYRFFFFKRYEPLFKNPRVLIATNAILFSLAHLGFRNGLVLTITLIGGVIFALTYVKTRSLLFTSIEHAIYGSWLFTVGMGEMLAFPMPE